MLTARPKRFSELPTESRKSLCEPKSLDRGLSTFYEYFLSGVMVLATILIVYLYSSFQEDASRDFLQVYFGIGYLVAMFLLVGQVLAARNRRTRPDYQEPRSPELDVVSGLRSILNAKALSWTEVHTPIDNQLLDRAQALIDAGITLQDTCTSIDSKYPTWDPARQELFRGAIQAALVLRRKAPRS